MEKSGEYLCPPATLGPPGGAGAERGAGGVVDEVDEGVGQGEGWGGQCGQGVSIEGLLRRLTRMIGEGGVCWLAFDLRESMVEDQRQAGCLITPQPTDWVEGKRRC